MIRSVKYLTELPATLCYKSGGNLQATTTGASVSVEIDYLANAWVAFAHASEGSRERKELLWAHEALRGMCLESPDEAWDAILAVLAREPDPQKLASLAAGPLQDLLVHHGPAMIQRVEKRAEADRAFATLLGRVRNNDNKHDI